MTKHIVPTIRYRKPHFEMLESRLPLTSLTVITHGLSLDGFPLWVYDMASAINLQAGYNCTGPQIIRSRMEANLESGEVHDSDFCDSLLLFDWADESNGPGNADNDDVAGRLAEFIRNRLAKWEGVSDVHIIGHSRGGFVVRSAVERLNNATDKAKIRWLQMTTLDPYPFNLRDNDGELYVPTNVSFADNYYQHHEAFQGRAGWGAFDTELTDVVSSWNTTSRGDTDNKSHSEIWAWYYWTINSSATAAQPFDSNPRPTESERAVLYSDTTGADLDGDLHSDAWGYDVSVFGELPPSNLNVARRVGTRTQIGQPSSDVLSAESIATSLDGSFVVVWQELESNDYDIWGRVYDSNGSPRGPAFLVSRTVELRQVSPRVIMYTDGDFTVVWKHEKAKEQFYVVGRSFTRDGVPITDEFPVSKDQVVYLAVASNPNGGFTVVWVDRFVNSATEQRIYARSLNRDGSALTEEVLAAVGNDGVFELSLAIDGIGNSIITWYSRTHVWVRQLDWLLRPRGLEFVAEASTTKILLEGSAVAAAPDGSFVVVWEAFDAEEPPDSDLTWAPSGIYARRYFGSGSPAGEPFRVNTVTDGMQFMPSVIILANGQIVIGWETWDWKKGGKGDQASYIRVFNGDGSAQGGEMFVYHKKTPPSDVGGPMSATMGGRLITVLVDASNRMYFQRHDISRPKQAISIPMPPDGRLFATQRASSEVAIDPSVSRLRVDVTYPGSDLDLEFVRPDGSRVVASDAGIERVETLTSEYYDIANPAAGIWKVEVIAIDVPPEGEPFVLTGLIDSSVSAHLMVGSEAQEVGAAIPILVSYNDGEAIRGANIIATILPPSGAPFERARLRLHDDGAHGDGTAGDGIYGNTFRRSIVPGTYIVEIDAQGNANAGFAVRRAPTSSFTVVAGADTDSDGLPDVWEDRERTDRLRDDSAFDTDRDTLTHVNEFLNGTSPLSPDTDGDQFSDAEELESLSDPLDKFITPPGVPGPKIVAYSPAQVVDETGLEHIVVTFSEWVDPASFTTNDIQHFSGPMGELIDAVTGIVGQGTQYTISFAAQSGPGIYTLTLGPMIEDVVGNMMDQDQDSITGEQSDDRFTAVIRINAPPSARDISLSTDEDTSVAISFMAHIEDSDGTIDPQTFTVVSQPTHGTLSFDLSNGAVLYSPHRNFSGSDSFRYGVADNDGAASSFGTVSIEIVPVNDAPADINLAGLRLDENNRGLVVGAITVADVEPTDTHQLTVSDPRFDVSQGQLKLKDDVQLNHETESTIELLIKATDSGVPALTYEEAFTLTVIDLNDSPVVINDLVTQVPLEDQPFSFTVPARTFFDEDGEALTIAAVLMDGTALPIWLSFDPQTANFSGIPLNENVGSFVVKVIATDASGASATAQFALEATNTNDQCQDVVMDNHSVAENDVGAVVGSLTVEDPDVGDAHTFTVSDGRFEVIEGRLKLREGMSLDHESAGQVDVIITAIDSGTPAFSCQQSFAIEVIDVNELPSRINLSNVTVRENDPGAIIGAIQVLDPENGSQVLSIVHDGDNDTPFEIAESTLKLKPGRSLLYVSGTERVTVHIRTADSLSPNVNRTDSFEIEVLVNANPWLNSKNRFDVNNDGLVTPVGDVLPLINELNNRQIVDGRGDLPMPPPAPIVLFYDVSADNNLSPAADVLPIINEINRQNDEAEAEWTSYCQPSEEQLLSPPRRPSCLQVGIPDRQNGPPSQPTSNDGSIRRRQVQVAREKPIERSLDQTIDDLVDDLEIIKRLCS